MIFYALVGLVVPIFGGKTGLHNDRFTGGYINYYSSCANFYAYLDE